MVKIACKINLHFWKRNNQNSQTKMTVEVRIASERGDLCALHSGLLTDDFFSFPSPGGQREPANFPDAYQSTEALVCCARRLSGVEWGSDHHQAIRDLSTIPRHEQPPSTTEPSHE